MIDPDAIFAYDFGYPEESYAARDAIIYALGLGLGCDPLDADDLRFLDERSLAVLPTFAVTRCTPGMWIRDPKLGVDFGKVVHAAQWAEFPVPLPPSARVRGAARVISLTDRGEGKGAILVLERTIGDAQQDAIFCRLRQTLLLRGDGGFAGPLPSKEEAKPPSGEPDARHMFAVSPRAALIYRLSGDWNPLHLDPAVAAGAGFSRPILHGLASYGIAGVAVSQALGHDPAAQTMLACRFSGVILPGDVIDFRIWRNGDASASFNAYVGERKVLDGGEIAWRVE